MRTIGLLSDHAPDEIPASHVDLPGFGASERREDLLSPRAVGKRIASAIVGSGGTAVPIQLGEPLASWVLDPDFDKYRRMDPRVIVGAAPDTIAGGVLDHIRADYLACYDRDRFAESMRHARRYPEELPAPLRSTRAGGQRARAARTPHGAYVSSVSPGVRLGVGGFGEGTMHTAAVGGVGRPVGGRPDQRVGELHPPAHLNKPGVHRGSRRRHLDAQRAGGAAEQP